MNTRDDTEREMTTLDDLLEEAQEIAENQSDLAGERRVAMHIDDAKVLIERAYRVGMWAAVEECE